MFFIMGITLYTSRVIIQALGISDFGIYNIVGGIVAMVGFINGAMAAGTQRFLSFDIGNGDEGNLKLTFNTAIIIHLFIGAIVLLIGETVGLWYINNILVFPKERILAVNLVYQFSLFTLFVNITQVPYNALILAKERMNIFAYFSIIEVVLKLVIAFSILFIDFDKLIIYSLLILIASIIIRFSYQVYSERNFSESKIKITYNKNKFFEILTFSGWNIFGAISLVAKNQGVNMILNLFFGTVVNAAYGLVMQVNSAVLQFVNSFQAAINPQIIQSYANDNKQKSLKLIFWGSKLSFFVMLIIVVPLMVHTNLLLSMWLGPNIPQFTVTFLKLSMISVLIDCISGPLMTGVLAVGLMRNYHIIIGGFNMIIPVLSYWLLSIGYSADIVFFLMISFSFLSLIFRVFFIKRYYNFELKKFLFGVILPIISGIILVFLIVYILASLFDVNNFSLFIIWYFLFLLLYFFGLFFVGLEKEMQNTLIFTMKKIIKR